VKGQEKKDTLQQAIYPFCSPFPLFQSVSINFLTH
jgi:hypothetical protein